MTPERRAELRKAWEDYQFHVGRGLKTRNWNDVADAMSALSDSDFAELLAAPQWISVKDRLPEGKDFDVLCRDGKETIVCEYRGNNWFVSKPGRWTVHPTHWQPLPSPPEEGPHSADR